MSRFSGGVHDDPARVGKQQAGLGPPCCIPAQFMIESVRQLGICGGKDMKTESPASPFRLVIGDILILLALLLTADVLIVMPKKIHAVVLKADYQEIFRYELIICAVLLLFALDVRFNLFTRSGHTGLRVAGWVLRIAVVLFTLVIAFFCGKVIRGGLINTAAGADHAIVLGLALEDGKPTDDLVSRLNTAQAYLQEYPEARALLQSIYHYLESESFCPAQEISPEELETLVP